MSDGKVPMPAGGQDRHKTHSDGVDDVDTRGRGDGGESGGGSYDNPHTGKEARGESGGFDGGQSVRGYYGPGQHDSAQVDPAERGTAGQGGNTADGGPNHSSATMPKHEPRQVTAAGQRFEIVEASGVAEAEANGKLGTDQGD